MQRHEFRWQALFQRTSEPVFVLNRKRRILFVNRAWEQVTGLSATEARGLVCVRHTPSPQDPWDLVIRALCCPVKEALPGRPSRIRRLVPGREKPARWWDIDFFPLRALDEPLCLVGKITVVSQEAGPEILPLPERLLALRQAIVQRHGLDQLASHLPAFHRVVDQVRLASRISAPVLILGEPGTGKHWLARAIHHHGLRAEGTFAALDCGRISPGTLTKVVFGENGLIQRAARGTLYIREPSRLPIAMQSRLCQVLAESDETASPRIVAGCSTDPAEEVQRERLLDELYCGLSTLVIKLPALCERSADLTGLVERFLERASCGTERRVKGLTSGAWEIVRDYNWPGNLRELYGVLQTACLRTPDDLIDACHLPARLRLAVNLGQTSGPAPERSLPLDQLLEEAERRLIRLALHKAQGNRSRAAELLSIWRPRLLRRMEALGIKEW